MDELFRTYHHAQAGFKIPVPAEWQVAEGVQGCALVAAEPAPESRGFVANIVVSVEPLGVDEPAEAWVARSRESLQDGRLNRLRLIDSEETEIGGATAWRTLSHYLHRPHGGVSLEQWQVAYDGWGFVVSCSTGALDYDAYADAMAYAAEGLQILA